MARPGIMFYFDMLGPLKALPDADKGRLLVAMLEYGRDGIVPEVDGMLALAWGFVRPKIDRDLEEYERTVLKDEDNYENAQSQRAYAAFCRKRYRLKLPKLSFEEWIDMDDEERQRAITGDAFRYPTTTTPTTTAAAATTPTTTPTTTAAAAAATTPTTTTEPENAATAAYKKVKVIESELGKDVVLLSEEQANDLLDKMGMKTFDHYIEKLANFIITNGAYVKNHYETILKWWKEDSVVPRRNKDKITYGASGKLGKAEIDAMQRLLAED